MLSRTAQFALLLTIAGSLACASTNSSQAAGTGAAPRSARSPDLITAQEVATSSAANAYDLIVRLRPQWLRSSGVASIGGGAARQGTIVAYLDNVRLGNVDNLRSVSAGGITSIRFLNAEQAASRFPESGGLVAGAVVVSTK